LEPLILRAVSVVVWEAITFDQLLISFFEYFIIEQIHRALHMSLFQNHIGNVGIAHGQRAFFHIKTWLVSMLLLILQRTSIIAILMRLTLSHISILSIPFSRSLLLQIGQ